MLPNQDEMPAGGLGNLIALPLQGNPRKEGNSVFVDDSWQVIDDQWTYLAERKPLSLAFLNEKLSAWQVAEEVCAAADEEEDSEDKPWSRKKAEDFYREDIKEPLPLTLADCVSFENVLWHVKAKYVYGLTATPMRDDGHEKIMFMQLGPVLYRLSEKQRAEMQDFAHEIYPRFTSFSPITASKQTINDWYKWLVSDDKRNQLIIMDVLESIEKGRTPLVLTKFKEHAEKLADMLNSQGILYGSRLSEKVLAGYADGKREYHYFKSQNMPQACIGVSA